MSDDKHTSDRRPETQRGPSAGPRRPRSLSRDQDRHRPGRRDRVLLRLPPGRALHPRGPRARSRSG
ncbi:MAG: hypothetical protein MZU79_04795 [Anaerotruncus sp.]|nr:hypothetical protein [Anaerotruncus sp.]